MLIDVLEWAGSLLGLLGAFLLATHTRFSRYGWLAFFAANLAMIAFALGIGRYGLLVQQVGFMGTSILGLYRAGFFRVRRPPCRVLKQEYFNTQQHGRGFRQRVLPG